MEQESKASNYKLSVLMPAKRLDRWVGVYNSIRDSFAYSWELIIITSHNLPEELKEKSNITLIHSERAPMHKQQIGLIRAKGEYITAISDDTLFVPNFLTETFKEFKGRDYKFYIILKYVEGENHDYPPCARIDFPDYVTAWDFMLNDDYYYVRRHDMSNLKYVPYPALVLSNAIFTKQVLLELGGWDCIYHTVPMANNDLAIRLWRYGCKGWIQPGMSQQCSWMPREEGDHSAVHLAFVKNDQPIFQKMWTTLCGADRLKIPLDNWKDTDEVWRWRIEAEKANIS